MTRGRPEQANNQGRLVTRGRPEQAKIQGRLVTRGLPEQANNLAPAKTDILLHSFGQGGG